MPGPPPGSPWNPPGNPPRPGPAGCRIFPRPRDSEPPPGPRPGPPGGGLMPRPRAPSESPRRAGRSSSSSSSSRRGGGPSGRPGPRCKINSASSSDHTGRSTAGSAAASAGASAAWGSSVGGMAGSSARVIAAERLTSNPPAAAGSHRPTCRQMLMRFIGVLTPVRMDAHNASDPQATEVAGGRRHCDRNRWSAEWPPPRTLSRGLDESSTAGEAQNNERDCEIRTPSSCRHRPVR